MLDLDAPIVPGVGAAELTLGDDVAKLLAARRPSAIGTLPGTGRIRYDFGPISIWEANGRIKQLRVSEGYRGKLDGVVGIGTTVAEVESHFGKAVEEDEEDSLIVQGVDGWCFETESWSSPSGTARENPFARITELFVYGSARPGKAR
jgi:hypothetical protein